VVEISRRRENVSWLHHAEVQAPWRSIGSCGLQILREAGAPLAKGNRDQDPRSMCLDVAA